MQEAVYRKEGGSKMKKFTKVCLIICLVLLCISAGCITAGAAMGSSIKEARQAANAGGLNLWGFNIGKWLFFWDYMDEFESEEDAKIINGVVNETFPAESIKELEMDLYYGNIIIEDSGSENITVSIDAPKRHSYKCKVSGDTMVLDETTKTWRHIINRNFTKPEVIIGIPEGKKFDQVELVFSAGKVTLDHSLTGKSVFLEVDAGQLTAEMVTAEELELETGAGEFILKDFITDSLSVDCGVGNMEIKGKAVEEADLTCGVGNILLNLTGKPEDYNYDISCGVGSIEINGKSFSGLGRNKLIDNGAAGEISLDCGVGAIEVEIEE